MAINELVQFALEEFFKRNKKMPDTIIVYRDGNIKYYKFQIFNIIKHESQLKILLGVGDS